MRVRARHIRCAEEEQRRLKADEANDNARLRVSGSGWGGPGFVGTSV